MNDQQILTGIEELTHKALQWNGTLRPEMRLIEDLELDSLKRLTLAVEVEDHFRICLDEQDEIGIETVGDLVAIVKSKLDAS